MNLEQIVKEIVAQTVAEKKGKDLTGDGKIDSADYLKARDIAIKKAQGKEMDEARFKKGEDVGGKGFEFKDIAKKAAKQYGSKEAGQRVAGAILKKVLNKEGELSEDGIDEAILSEDIDNLYLAATLVAQAAILGGNLGMLAGKHIDSKGVFPNIDDVKRWWKNRKDDKAVKSIIAKIKSDPEMIEFFKMSQTQQRGKFRKLVASKLSAEELQYLNKINKSDLQQNELDKDNIDEAVPTDERFVHYPANNNVLDTVKYKLSSLDQSILSNDYVFKHDTNVNDEGDVVIRMYAKPRFKSKNSPLAENEDHEVAMAQSSLDSIIRSAMELKAKIGDQEIDIPAWIQDHITNSENYIEQASQGYHEYENGGHEEMNEEYNFEQSAIESASGDKISHTEEDDYGRTIYWSTKNPNVNYFVGQGGEFEGKIYLYNGETGERYPIGDLKHYGAGQNHTADDDMHESQKINEANEKYYAIFDVYGKPVYYAITNSAQEMLSILNGRLKSIGDNPAYDMNSLEDDYYNGQLLDTVISDDFAYVTKNPEVFKKHLADYSNIVKYIGTQSQEVDEAFIPKSSFDDYSVGDNVTVAGKKAKITNMKMDTESGERIARVKFEDGSTKEVNINSLDEAQDISDDELTQLQATADDTSKMPAERDAARNKIYASRAKKESQELDEVKHPMFDKLVKQYISKGYSEENAKKQAAADINAGDKSGERSEKSTFNYNESQELDEATIRRWQHYAGIK